MVSSIYSISEILRPVFQKYHVSKAIVFGSYAKGSATRKSDLDLVLIKNTSLVFFKRYDGLYLDISEKLPHQEIDLLIYTPDEIENISHRKFVRKIINEGITIYERTKKPARG